MTKAHVGTIDMYYELHGEGDPLVLIGGLAGDISQSAWLTDWCARTHHVLAFDNRGAGRTDMPVSSYTIPMMANDTDGLMEVVGMRRATVLGISMGGRIAMDLALEHPDRVARLILVSTKASATPRGSPTPFDALGVLSGVLFRGRHPQPRYAFARQREASRSYDCVERLGEIHVPTTILHGRKDKIAPLSEAERMHRGITGSRMVTFNGGHLFFLIRERPAFLESLEAALSADLPATAS
jgi:3-oxoadipate enol-lactonase